MLIIFGGNKYGVGMGNARLRGCDPDITAYFKDWQSDYYQPNIRAEILADERCHAPTIRKALLESVKVCDKEPAGHHDSSHGTTIGGDGALCCYYSDWRDNDSFLLARHFRDIYKQAPAGGRIFLTIDACEFGDSVRGGLGIGALESREPRYMQPDIGTLLLNEHVTTQKALESAGILEIDHRDMPHVACIAGCKRGPGFTCSDVTDQNGHSFGAFTRAFVEVKRAGMTAREITEAANKWLSQYGHEQRAVCSGGLVDVPWMSLK